MLSGAAKGNWNPDLVVRAFIATENLVCLYNSPFERTAIYPTADQFELS